MRNVKWPLWTWRTLSREESYRLVVQRSPLKDKDGSRLRNLSPDPPFIVYYVMQQQRYVNIPVLRTCRPIPVPPVSSILRGVE